MIIYDFFAGTGSSTQAFADAGHTVVTVELDPQFDVTLTADVLDLDVEGLVRWFGRPNFVWASPPCTAFSVASIGHHWGGGRRAYLPKTDAARDNQELVAHTLRLIAGLNPVRGWVMENPRGVLRKLPCVRGIPRVGVTYCQYGDGRMKPTDLWGGHPAGWVPRPMCRNGGGCHESAPRGAKTGTQGLVGARDRSRVPYELGASLLEACETATEVAA